MPRNFTFFLQNHSVFRLILPVLLLALTSCEKVLDIDLKDAETRIIIEANLSDQPGTHTVKISRSVGFNAPNDFPKVTGANVTISDNAGNSEVLIETEAGIYQTVNFIGIPGRTYVLRVQADGKEFSSVSVMPQPIPIQSIKVEPFQFDPDDIVATITYQDPAGVRNYFRAIYQVNDTIADQLNFFSDEFNDGKLVDESFFDNDLQLDPGDSVNIKLQAIDENVFRFLREQSQLGNPQASAPANPTSTFTNGALGYFSAHAETQASMVVK